MKSGWKKIFFWSSLGSIALGAAVALVRKPKKKTLPVWQRIPLDCTKATIYTIEYENSEDAEIQLVRDKYVLLPTAFKVWSVLNPRNSADGEASEGANIYYITHWRSYKKGEIEDERVLDRLYGTISGISAEGDLSPKNYLARGACLAIHECRVGGASNGVETGEVSYSRVPILNYRFDYTPA
jgi:hypothetical protein